MNSNHFAVLGLSLLLAGCGATFQAGSLYQGASVSATSGAAERYKYNKQTDDLKQVLAKQGGQLVVLGDKVRIILPADILFDPNKERLKYNVEPMLIAVANYLEQFKSVCITVAGYTDAMPNRAANIELSQLRAQRIASFLWSKGFNEHCLKVKGYGQADAIASNSTLRGRAFNRRIEITL